MMKHEYQGFLHYIYFSNELKVLVLDDEDAWTQMHWHDNSRNYAVLKAG
jgi:hypothetical protein